MGFDCWTCLTLLLHVSEPYPVLVPPGQHLLHLSLLLRGQELGEVAAQAPAVLGGKIELATNLRKVCEDSSQPWLTCWAWYQSISPADTR